MHYDRQTQFLHNSQQEEIKKTSLFLFSYVKKKRKNEFPDWQAKKKMVV
jgi:hypothetical protein